MEEPQDVTADRIVRDLLLPLRNTSKSEININAGGIGVWVACTACLVMLGLMLLGALWMSREFSRVDQQLVEIREENKTMQSYLDVIYQVAPHLKPPEKQQ